MNFERAITLTRGVIDLDTGEFPLTLMTNGEASDGHIVDIRSLVVPDSMPMFVNHEANPIERMGSMHSPHKAGKSTRLGGASLKMVGRIDMQGDSALADIRRDVAQGIKVGDITNLSGRWDGGKETSRATLDKKHFAFSDVSGGWSTPTFFEGSRMIEGSIVGVGADQAALVGRSGDLGKPEHVREFYNALVHGEADPTLLDVELEEIELEGGARVLVPCEVAEDWNRERIELTSEPEVEEITAEVEASVDTRSDSTEERTEPEAALSGFSNAGTIDVLAIMRESREASDILLKQEVEKLLHDTLGVLPNG